MKPNKQYEVKEVIFYAISRLNFHRIAYTVHNSTTGSTYIEIGTDKIRIADHPGVYDDYNFVIRCDCKNPTKRKGIIAVSAENADTVLNIIINKYKKPSAKYGGVCKPILQRIIQKKSWNDEEYKRIDISLLLKIIKYDKSKESPPSKVDCLKMIIKNRELLSEYYDDE